jgi:hypothetical protein
MKFLNVDSWITWEILHNAKAGYKMYNKSMLVYIGNLNRV